MSVELHVFFDRSCLPSLDDLTARLASLGFVVQPEPVDIAEHQGFWPATFQGNASGFEFQISDAASVAGEYELDLPTAFDSVATASMGGDLDELLCALCVLSAFADLTGGVYLDPQTDLTLEPAAALLRMTRQELGQE